MAEGGIREGIGSDEFVRRLESIERRVNSTERYRTGTSNAQHSSTRQGFRQNFATTHSGPIYEFVEQLPEDRLVDGARSRVRGFGQNVTIAHSGPAGGARSLVEEHVYEEIQDVYDVAQEGKQLNISNDLRDDSEIWRTADRRILKSKFGPAILLIKDFPPTQRQQLLMSECYLQLDKMSDANKCIRTLETLVMSRSSPGNVAKTILGYITSESYIRALLLLSCLSKMYKVKSDPNKAVKGIKSCSYKCGIEVIPEMIQRGGRLRDIAIDLGLQMINDMLTDLRSVTGSDSNIKAKCESLCLNNIGYCYFTWKNYQKSLELYHQGVDVMRKQFGSHVSKYRVFGILLNNVGLVHKFLGNFSDAYAFFTQALQVYEVVEDWANDNKKQQEIARANKNQIIALKPLEK